MLRETAKRINEVLSVREAEDRGKCPRTLLREAAGSIVDIAWASDDASSDMAAIRAIVLLIRWIEQE